MCRAAALSRVSSYDWFGSLAFQPLGFAIWGPVAELAGVSTTLWVAFALQMVDDDGAAARAEHQTPARPPETAPRLILLPVAQSL